MNIFWKYVCLRSQPTLFLEIDCLGSCKHDAFPQIKANKMIDHLLIVYVKYCNVEMWQPLPTNYWFTKGSLRYFITLSPEWKSLKVQDKIFDFIILQKYDCDLFSRNSLMISKFYIKG